MDKSKLLSGSTLFCDLSSEELDGIAQHAELRDIRTKQVVIEQGTPGDEMYAVLHGRLKVSRISNDGREATLAILEGGEVFGEIAMLDGGLRTACVEALEPCKLLVLRRDTVLGHLETHPKVMRQLIAALCQRLRSADELLQDALFLPITQRLAKVLRQLSEQHGSSGPNGVLIDLKLTQQEIANLVGASRESVNKQLNAWESEGLIERVSSGYIRLLKPGALPV